MINTLDFQYWHKYPDFFVHSLKTSFTQTGFFLLKNHTIPTQLLKYNKELFAKFFKELSIEQRMKYSFPDIYYQKGYTPMRIETGEFAKDPDNKHFYQLGDMYENPYVEEIEELKTTSEHLFQEFYKVYKELMRATALSLDLPKKYFDNQLGNSIMRVIHYPANSVVVSDDEEVTRGGNLLGMCASKHTDINDLTLLHATEPGLELHHKGKWVPILCDANTIIVNVGDMIWHLTAGKYKSGLHRVVCEPGVGRISCPFFGHRIDSASIEPLFDLRDDEALNYSFKTEGTFLQHRLNQIIKKS